MYDMQRKMHLFIAFCLSGLAFSVATPQNNYTTTKNVAGGIALSASAVRTANTTSKNLTTINTDARITKPGCQHQCGNLSVPYPFGIGIGCSIDLWFDINCNTSFNPPKPFIGTRTSTIEIFDISDSKLWVSNMVAQKCYARSGAIIQDNTAWPDLSASPFTFSEENKFTVIGCDDRALLSGYNNRLNFTSGCLSLCSDLEHVIDSSCSGIGCCQTSIPKGLQYFKTSLYAWRNDTRVRSFDPCSYAFFSQLDSFTFRGAADISDPAFVNRTQARVPVVLDWAIGNLSCTEALNSNALACQLNSYCIDSDSGIGGYRCICNRGYTGNPYLSSGCQDVNECEDPNNNPCEGTCINTQGSYNCSCPHGFLDHGHGCRSQFPVIKLSVGLVFGFLFLLAMVVGLYLIIKKWILARRINYYFMQNGGWLYQAKINQFGRVMDLPRVFTAKELEKATNNYADDMILGRGAYSIVYKGILLDARVVAIKKSKMMDKNETEHFINELVILAQINHRNVVRLLGCCFESETPTLVYEFVSNNTLFHHIHNGSGAWLSWQMRLKIAHESAAALSYLHSAASVPIIHRDIKSTNILLDDDYAAKVSDFGASRLIPLDESKLATLVVGTVGYLDPEYYLTNQLTKKSDVYSFGVLLAELLTGKKSIFQDSNQVYTHLGTYFTKSLEENDLIQILEPRLVEEGTIEELQAVAELVKECLSMDSRDRPTMKEVSVKLDAMLRKCLCTVTSNTSPEAKRAPEKNNRRKKLLAAFKAFTSRNEKKQKEMRHH